MFFDVLATADLRRYPKRIAEALNWLKAQDLETLPAGSYEIDGRALYAQVMDVQTKPIATVKPERHRKYLDVQYIYRGAEMMGVALETGKNPIAVPYDEERDILFYESSENEHFIQVLAGQFMVFFPEDVHRPTVTDGEPSPVRKVVVKVAMDSL